MRNIERIGRMGKIGRLAGVGVVLVGAGVGFELLRRGGDSTAEPSRASAAAGNKLDAIPTATLVAFNPSAVTPDAVRTPLSTAIATATRVESAVVPSTMELPKPAAWDHAPVVSLVKAVNVPSWPKTVAEAATTFGVDGSTRDPKRWELTPDGGWHLSEAQIGDDTKDALNVNPGGWLVEVYYDTKPGRNPYACVAVGIDSNIPAQGATFWKEQRIDQAGKLQKEMATPKWKDENGNPFDHPVVIIVPNQEQKTEAVQTAPIEYPTTAEKAASLFNGKPENREKNSDGGWHLKPQDNEVEVNLGEFVMDGYNTEGQFVATGEVKAQGGTVWPVKGQVELEVIR